ncbi:hypothetical protein MTO96_021945, partial [Rhipicephalus appendiculatus]
PGDPSSAARPAKKNDAVDAKKRTLGIRVRRARASDSEATRCAEPCCWRHWLPLPCSPWSAPTGTRTSSPSLTTRSSTASLGEPGAEAPGAEEVTLVVSTQDPRNRVTLRTSIPDKANAATHRSSILVQGTKAGSGLNFEASPISHNATCEIRAPQELLILDMQTDRLLRALLIRVCHLIRDAGSLTLRHRTANHRYQVHRHCNPEGYLREMYPREGVRALYSACLSFNRWSLVLLLQSQLPLKVDIRVTLAVSIREVASRAAPWISILDVGKTPILQASSLVRVMATQASWVPRLEGKFFQRFLQFFFLFRLFVRFVFVTVQKTGRQPAVETEAIRTHIRHQKARYTEAYPKAYPEAYS